MCINVYVCVCVYILRAFNRFVSSFIKKLLNNFRNTTFRLNAGIIIARADDNYIFIML